LGYSRFGAVEAPAPTVDGIRAVEAPAPTRRMFFHMDDYIRLIGVGNIAVRDSRKCISRVFRSRRGFV